MRRHNAIISHSQLLGFGRLPAGYSGQEQPTVTRSVLSFSGEQDLASRAMRMSVRHALLSVTPPGSTAKSMRGKSSAQIMHERRVEEARLRKEAARAATPPPKTTTKQPTSGTSNEVVQPTFSGEGTTIDEGMETHDSTEKEIPADEASIPQREALTLVKEVDMFAKSRLQNYLKKFLTDNDPSGAQHQQHDGGDALDGKESFSATYGVSDVARAFSTFKNSSSNDSSKTKGSMSWRTDVRVPVRRPDGTVMVVHGVGYASDDKSSSVVAAMHAERCLDEIGVQIFALPRMQQRHAEAARLQGRFAPQPTDHQRRDDEISIPYPLVFDAAAPSSATKPLNSGVKAFVGSAEHVARIQREKEAREKKKYAIRYVCDPFGRGSTTGTSAGAAANQQQQDLLKDLREGKYFTDIQNEGGDDDEGDDQIGLSKSHDGPIVGGIQVKGARSSSSSSHGSNGTLVEEDGTEVLEVSFESSEEGEGDATEGLRMAGNPQRSTQSDTSANFGIASQKQAQSAQDPNRKLLHELDSRAFRAAARHTDKVNQLAGLTDETEGGYFGIVDDQDYISCSHTTFSFGFVSKVAQKNVEGYLRSYYRIERAIQLQEAEAELADGGDGGQLQVSDTPPTAPVPEGLDPDFAFLSNVTEEAPHQHSISLTQRLDHFEAIGRKLGMPPPPTLKDLISMTECEGVVTVDMDMKTDVLKWYTSTMLVPGIQATDQSEEEQYPYKDKFPNRPRYPYLPALAMGRALTPERAKILCAMHAEAIIDAYGLPLYPENDSLQQDHAESCLSYERWAISPESYKKEHRDFKSEEERDKIGGTASRQPQLLLPYSNKANLANPKPLKEWRRLLKRSGQKARHRVSKLNDEELFMQVQRIFITRHRMHITEFGLIRNLDDIEELNLCKRLVKEFIANAPKEHKELRRNCFISYNYQENEQVRTSILLPLPKQYGLRGGYAIACTTEMGEGLAALHAVDTLCALCIPVSKDPKVQADLVAMRKAKGRIVPMASAAEVHPLMRSPPGYRETPDTTSRPPNPAEVWRVMLLDAENFDTVKHPKVDPPIYIASSATCNPKFDFACDSKTRIGSAIRDMNIISLLRQIVINYFVVNNIDDKGFSEKTFGIASRCSNYNGHQRKGSLTSVPANNFWMELPVPRRFGRRVAWGRCITRRLAVKALLVHIVRILFTLGLYPNERPRKRLQLVDGEEIRVQEVTQTYFPGKTVQHEKEPSVEYHSLRVSPVDGSLVPEPATPMPAGGGQLASSSERFKWDLSDWALWCSLPDGILAEPKGKSPSSPPTEASRNPPTSSSTSKFSHQGVRVTEAEVVSPPPESKDRHQPTTPSTSGFKGMQGVYGGKVWLGDGTCVDEDKFPAAWAIRMHRETLEKMTGGRVPDNIPTPNPVTTSFNYDVVFVRKY